MSEANVVTSAKIKYCPVCGFKSEKPFNEGCIDDGGDWTCENCHEYVEAYVLAQDENDDDDSIPNTVPVFLWIISGMIVFALLVYFL